MCYKTNYLTQQMQKRQFDLTCIQGQSDKNLNGNFVKLLYSREVIHNNLDFSVIRDTQNTEDHCTVLRALKNDAVMFSLSRRKRNI